MRSQQSKPSSYWDSPIYWLVKIGIPLLGYYNPQYVKGNPPTYHGQTEVSRSHCSVVETKSVDAIRPPWIC